MMKFPIYGKITHGNQTTNQLGFLNSFHISWGMGPSNSIRFPWPCGCDHPPCFMVRHIVTSSVFLGAVGCIWWNGTKTYGYESKDIYIYTFTMFFTISPRFDRHYETILGWVCKTESVDNSYHKYPKVNWRFPKKWWYPKTIGFCTKMI